MADEINEVIAEESKKQTMPIIGEITEMAIGMITKKFPSLAKTLGASIDGAVEKSSDFFSELFTTNAEEFGEELRRKIEKFGGEAAGMLLKVGGAVYTGIDEAAAKSDVKGTLSNIQKSATDFITQNPVQLGLFLGEAGISERMESLMDKPIIKSMIAMESRIKDISGGFIGSIAGMRGSFSEMTVDANTMSQSIGASINEVGKAMKELGVTQGTSKQAMDAYLKTGLGVGELNKLEIGTHGTKEALTGLSAALAVAKATGMSVDEVTSSMSKQMKTLGVEGENVAKVFSTIKATQEGTRLSFESTHNSLISGAMSLKYYGTNAESLSGIFKTLNEGLGKGKEALTGELFQSALGGLTGMDFSKKAFISSTTQMGQGRDVVGAGLQYEQNIEEGKIDELMSAFKETLVKYGGSGEVLTRKEALDTGKTTEYLQQRQIGAQFLGISDPGQWEAFAKSLKGEGRKAEEFIGAGRRDEGRTFAEEGRTTFAIEEGVLGSAVNRAKGEAINALGNFTSSFVENSKQISDAVGKFQTELVKDFEGGLMRKLVKSGAVHEEVTAETADSGERVSRKSLEGAASYQDRGILNPAMQETKLAYGQKGMENLGDIMPTVSGIKTLPAADYQLGQGMKFNFDKDLGVTDNMAQFNTINTRNKFDTEGIVSQTKQAASNFLPAINEEIKEAALKKAIDVVGNLTLKIKLDTDGSVRLVTEDALNEFKITLKNDKEDSIRNSVN